MKNNQQHETTPRNNYAAGDGSDFELNWFDLETRMRKLVYELL